jgi:hypothetical protein
MNEENDTKKGHKNAVRMKEDRIITTGHTQLLNDPIDISHQVREQGQIHVNQNRFHFRVQFRVRLQATRYNINRDYHGNKQTK